MIETTVTEEATAEDAAPTTDDSGSTSEDEVAPTEPTEDPAAGGEPEYLTDLQREDRNIVRVFGDAEGRHPPEVSVGREVFDKAIVIESDDFASLRFRVEVALRPGDAKFSTGLGLPQSSSSGARTTVTAYANDLSGDVLCPDQELSGGLPPELCEFPLTPDITKVILDVRGKRLILTDPYLIASEP